MLCQCRVESECTLSSACIDTCPMTATLPPIGNALLFCVVSHSMQGTHEMYLLAQATR